MAKPSILRFTKVEFASESRLDILRKLQVKELRMRNWLDD
jgi:hypothetical protein